MAALTSRENTILNLQDWVTYKYILQCKSGFFFLFFFSLYDIRPCQTAAILSMETNKALFYHAKPRSGNHEGEAWRGKTKLFWSPGTIWPPCDKGEYSLQ